MLKPDQIVPSDVGTACFRPLEPLVIVSSRSRRVVRWLLGLSLFLSTAGLGMMIIASGCGLR